MTFVVDWALNNRSIFKERTCDEPVSFPTDEHHAARFTAFSPDNRQTTRPSRGSVCCPTHSPATDPVDRVIKFHALCVCVSLSFFSLILSPAYPPTTTTTTTTRKKEKKKKKKKERRKKKKKRERERTESLLCQRGRMVNLAVKSLVFRAESKDENSLRCVLKATVVYQLSTANFAPQ